MHGAQAHEQRLAHTSSLFHLLATSQGAINPALPLKVPHPAPLLKHSLICTHTHVSHRLLALCFMRLTASAGHTMFPSLSISLVLLLLALLFCRPTSSEVIQVQIIHRHGARPPLRKNPTNTSDETRPISLYPDGVAQLQELGTYVRKTYINSASSIVDIAETPTGRDIIARTSNLYRTILSSRAFLDAVYPDEKLVPLVPLVFEEERNDWILRGYSLCPALDERFAEFRDSEEFKNKQKEKPEGQSETNDDFVIRIAKNFDDYKDDDAKASFFNVWAVYDRYLIIHNDGYGEEKWKEDSPELQGVDKLSDEELTRLRDLADWHETRKYDFGVHNIHIAGGLLRTIMGQARRMQKSGDKKPNHRIVEYSAHYPTLLTLLGSLREKNSDRNEFPADKIPGFGAAIIFELHSDDSDDSKGPVMKLKWWEGYSERNEDADVEFTPFAIGRQPCTEADEGCTFADMERLVALDDLGEKSFCEDCASSANVCKVSRTQETSEESEDAQAQCATGTKVASGVIGAVVGLIVGVLFALFYITLRARRKRNQMVIPEREFAAEGDFLG
ncbi:unnamed protein product [Chondrus crispus]|uniref:Acid phosphatase n=1 Tax=Chondrus crispus TaxID=2769 RepID=R7QKR7_CHOCR|nr:unnamed protein product [Chondrus crispus]CDF38066.1 unnamed protein product [Chondrus crispus]|eukprot:XP_005717935.1 unnamed protein product [Chondrus crispus]